MSPGPRITAQSAQSFVQIGLENLQQWRLHSFSRQAGPGLIAVMVTAIFFFFFYFFSSSLWQIRPFSAQFKTTVTCPSSLLCLLSDLSLLDFARLPHDTSQLMGSRNQEEVCYLHQYWNTC